MNKNAQMVGIINLWSLFGRIDREISLFVQMGEKFDLDLGLDSCCFYEDYGTYTIAPAPNIDEEDEEIAYTYQHDFIDHRSFLVLGKEVDIVDDDIEDENQYVKVTIQKENIQIEFMSPQGECDRYFVISPSIDHIEEIDSRFFTDLYIIMNHIWRKKINPKIQREKNRMVQQLSLGSISKNEIEKLSFEYGTDFICPKAFETDSIATAQRAIHRLAGTLQTTVEKKKAINTLRR